MLHERSIISFKVNDIYKKVCLRDKYRVLQYFKAYKTLLAKCWIAHAFGV